MTEWWFLAELLHHGWICRFYLCCFQSCLKITFFNLIKFFSVYSRSPAHNTKLKKELDTFNPADFLYISQQMFNTNRTKTKLQLQSLIYNNNLRWHQWSFLLLFYSFVCVSLRSILEINVFDFFFFFNYGKNLEILYSKISFVNALVKMVTLYNKVH